jgi:hypothetical protein
MARLQQETQAAVTTGQPNIPAFPAQWCYGLYVISLVRRACWPPSPARRVGPVRADIAIPQNLIPASGNQDHTISPSAYRIARQLMGPRPSHPAPRFVTIAKRLSCRRGTMHLKHNFDC